MEQLYELFRSFINDIIKVFPEYEERLHDTYEDLFLEDKEKIPEDYLKDFLKKIEKNNEKISFKDDTFFSSDPIIIPNISFKMIWNSKISKKTEKTIWKYLITFGTMEIQLRCGERIENVLKSIDEKEKVKDKKTVEDMKKLKRMNDLLQDEKLWEKEVIEDLPGLPEGMEGMEQILGNTNIGKIAQEITQELDIEKMMGGGEGGIENLFQGGNIMNIFQSINSKIESKVSADGFKKEDLLGEANDICGSMKDNPLFSSLMGNMQQSMGQPSQTNTSNPDPNLRNINLNSDPHNNSKTKKRLQKKLQDKKDKEFNIEKVE